MPQFIPISLAPLRGVTVHDFRAVFARRFGGVDYAVAPFIPTVAGTTVPPKLLKDIAPVDGLRTVPQLIGKDPAQLRVMATALRDLGFAEMNLNCGCPWKFVAKKGRGSGLPEDENNFARMLEAGCDAMPDGFSIKIRLGMKDNATLAKRAALIASFPLKEIIIHPRTGTQMYEGAVDLDAFADVLPTMRCPVVYNGDIKTLEDYRRITTRFPTLSGVMLGRGLIADPFLASDIKSGEKTPCNPAAVSDFLNELYRIYRITLCGPSPVLGRMKELWGITHEYFDEGARILRAVQRSNTLDEYEKVTNRGLPPRLHF